MKVGIISDIACSWCYVAKTELVRFKQGGIGFDSKIVNDFDDAGTIRF